MTISAVVSTIRERGTCDCDVRDRNRVWPIESMRSRRAVLCEGLRCIALIQLVGPAGCSTVL
jgi:hypothetical protein